MLRAMTGALLLSAATAGAAAEEHRIGMIGAAYAPSTVVAKAGDVLVFENDDVIEHDVFSPTNGFGFDLGSQEAGETRRYTVGKTGTFEVECVFHPEMHLTVAVIP